MLNDIIHFLPPTTVAFGVVAHATRVHLDLVSRHFARVNCFAIEYISALLACGINRNSFYRVVDCTLSCPDQFAECYCCRHYYFCCQSFSMDPSITFLFHFSSCLSWSHHRTSICYTILKVFSPFYFHRRRFKKIFVSVLEPFSYSFVVRFSVSRLRDDRQIICHIAQSMCAHIISILLYMYQDLVFLLSQWWQYTFGCVICS